MWRIIILITSFALLACNNETAPQTAPQTETLKPQAEANVDWTLHGNDAGEQRFSLLDQINRGNVDTLGLTWSFDMS